MTIRVPAFLWKQAGTQPWGEDDEAPVWTPADITTVAWYDVSDLATVFSDSAGTTPASVDGPVGRLGDKSGNGHHLTVPDIDRPTLRQSGAIYYLENASAKYIGVAFGASFAQPNQILVAGRISSTSGQHHLIDADQGVANPRHVILRASDVWSLYAGDLLSFDAADTSDHVFNALYNGASSSFRVDGVAQSVSAGTTVSTNALTGLTIFQESGAANLASGRFYGGVISDTALSAGDQTSAEAWMADLFF